MNDVTRILSAVEQGDRHAAAQLLPLVYEELRKLAAQRLAREAPGGGPAASAAVVHEGPGDRIGPYRVRGGAWTAVGSAGSCGAGLRDAEVAAVGPRGVAALVDPERESEVQFHQCERILGLRTFGNGDADAPGDFAGLVGTDRLPGENLRGRPQATSLTSPPVL